MYEGPQIFRELLDSLGRNVVFQGNAPLSEDEWRTWMFWTETSFLPRNRQIRDLLTSKPHLVDGGAFPASYIAFLHHESSWRIHHERWLTETVPYAWRSSVNWPREFEDEVIATFTALKARHTELLGTLNHPRRQPSRRAV